MNIKWNQVINALVLIKIGQDLGTYSKTSVAVHDIIELISSLFSVIGTK